MAKSFFISDFAIFHFWPLDKNEKLISYPGRMIQNFSEI
jgi:hypothetical protein